MTDSPPAVVAVILVLMYLFVVVACVWTGIKGLKGGPVWLPRRGGVSEEPATGGCARVIGVVFLAIALLLLVPVLRGVCCH